MKLKLVLVLMLLIALVGCSSALPIPAANAPTTAPAADSTTDATADSTATDATATDATADVATNDDATPEATTEASQPSQPTSTPEPCPPGWVICKTLDDPKIIIRASRLVSQSAVDAVAHIYTDMTSRFNPAYPKDKFDGYIIYLTNGEPWSELQNLNPVGTMWSGTVERGIAQGDDLRGGTGSEYLWIEEQMICKKGVQTRNDAFAAGKRSQRDDTIRTFDQVIHEFAHAIDMRYNLRSRVMTVHKDNANPVERFPQSIQSIFGSPSIPINDGERAFLNEIFSSSTTYSCDMYEFAQVHTVKLEVGKQYAFREANNTFRYFQLTSIDDTAQGGPIRIDLCPKPGEMGWINMTDPSNLTTVETALAEKLTPKSEPCSTEKAPHGVFINGASLPNTRTPGASVSQPTAAPAQPTAAPAQATAAPATGSNNAPSFQINVRQQYALRNADKTFSYIHIHLYRNQVMTYYFDLCPTVSPNSATAQNTIVDPTNITSVDGALTEGYVAKNAQCDTTQAPFYTGSANPYPYKPTLQPQAGKQYAFRNGDNTFTYLHYVGLDNSIYTFATCPNTRLNGPPAFKIANPLELMKLMTVSYANAQGLTPSNETCSTPQG